MKGLKTNQNDYWQPSVSEMLARHYGLITMMAAHTTILEWWRKNQHFSRK
jgi:hypothetical protein